jgi:hypothetical protein
VSLILEELERLQGQEEDMSLKDLPIYNQNEEATQAELNSAARAYIPKTIPGNTKEFSAVIDKFIHHVWGQLVLDRWTCNKEHVCIAVNEAWNLNVTCQL